MQHIKFWVRHICQHFCLTIEILKQYNFIFLLLMIIMKPSHRRNSNSGSDLFVLRHINLGQVDSLGRDNS